METCIHQCKISSFADDTRISKKISTVDNFSVLPEDLKHIIRWSEENNMKLHENKFELLCCRTPAAKNLSEALPFMGDVTNYKTPNGIILDKSPIVRDLGVNLSEDLSWSPHINIMTENARQVASWVLGVSKDRSKTLMLQLNKSLIKCRVEYCCPLWNPSKTADIQAIESIQRHFTRRIHGLKTDNYWDRLKELKLTSLQRRREKF